MCIYTWFVLSVFYVLLLVFSVICMHQGSESNAISILCMYVYGRIDNKAVFDFDYRSLHSLCDLENLEKSAVYQIIICPTVLEPCTGLKYRP